MPSRDPGCLTDWPKSSFAPLRPQHPGMLNAEDLTPGRRVLRHNRDGSVGHARVISAPAEDDSVRLAVPRYPATLGEYETTGFLADMGMIEYSPGVWNPTNYVTAAEDA